MNRQDARAAKKKIEVFDLGALGVFSCCKVDEKN
jgi:hypothetical protein